MCSVVEGRGGWEGPGGKGSNQVEEERDQEEEGKDHEEGWRGWDQEGRGGTKRKDGEDGTSKE